MSLIPFPSQRIFTGGEFAFSPGVGVSSDPELSLGAELFSGIYEKAFGSAPTKGTDINFRFDPSLPPEGYKLSVGENSVTAFASSQNGGIYAAQTLRQLAGIDYTKGAKILCQEIFDASRFGWRGVSFDVSRHFFGAAEIIRFLEHMSLLKLNVLHLHLSDDQGFRVEMEKYPELNKIGSFRDGTLLHDGKEHVDNVRYGGFYTKDQIRLIVAHAQKLGIDVVPEIDLPGHTIAMVASLPELGCTGKKIPVRTKFGISPDILCGGNPVTYAVVCDILDEVSELFPSKYFHLGGDEAPKKNWKNCPRCQGKIAELGLKDENALQSHMFNFFAEYLAQKGKTVIGWNECLTDALDKNIVCQHWTPKAMGKNRLTAKHVNNGRKAIVSDFTKTYLDYAYAMTPMVKTFGFDPFTTLTGIKPQNAQNVLGVECNIWTEFIPGREKLDFNVFPRILAFAENAWRTDRLSYDGFVKRLQDFYPVLDALGIGYAENSEYPQPFFRRLPIIYKSLKSDAFIELNGGTY